MKIKNIIKKFLTFTRLYQLENGIYILPYHMVSTKKNLFFPDIDLTTFKLQMSFLSRHFVVIPLDEINRILEKKRCIGKYVVITFDDGFKDNYTKAYPILKKYNFPATIFVLCNSFLDQQPPWFIVIRFLFKETKKQEIKIKLNGREYLFKLSNNPLKFKASSIVINNLKKVNLFKREELIAKLKYLLNVHDLSPIVNIILTKEQIKEMLNDGISVGAHTLTHPSLGYVNLYEAKKEILLSKEILSYELSTHINAFAYPFGQRDDIRYELSEILKRGGFKCALTSIPGKNSYKTNRYFLLRSYPLIMR